MVSCSQKQPLKVFYDNKNSIFVFNDDFLTLYHHTFSNLKVFKEKEKNLFCGDSWNYNCFDSNRNGYETCISFKFLGNGIYQLTSSDTCISNKMNHLGSIFNDISLKEMEISWDSIIITNKDLPMFKKKILHSEAKIQSIPNHPLTLSQEIYFMSVLKCRLHYSPSTIENTFSINVYYNGQVIDKSSGNLFPNILKNLSMIAYKNLE